MKTEEVTLLERFVLDNPDLERLKASLDEFNPFVAMRWTRQETRHSCFLRWLLDPSETHGLGPYFLMQGGHKQIAVKVIDDRGNELLVVKKLGEGK